jgi:hypothetical protein
MPLDPNALLMVFLKKPKLIQPEIYNRFPNRIETERKSDYWENNS